MTTPETTVGLAAFRFSATDDGEVVMSIQGQSRVAYRMDADTARRVWNLLAAVESEATRE